MKQHTRSHCCAKRMEFDDGMEKLTKENLLSLEAYDGKRNQFRAEVMEHKKIGDSNWARTRRSISRIC